MITEEEKRTMREFALAHPEIVNPLIEIERLRRDRAALLALLQEWRFSSHDRKCGCSKCVRTRELCPGLPYYPEQGINGGCCGEKS